MQVVLLAVWASLEMWTAGRRQKTAKLRERPHFARGIWKRSFLSTSRPTVHTHPFRKRSFSNRRKLKTLTFRFRVDRKHFENEPFRKSWRQIIIWFPWPKFPQTPKIQNDWWSLGFFNSSCVVWMEKKKNIFRVKPASIFKISWRSPHNHLTSLQRKTSPWGTNQCCYQRVGF